DQAACRKRAATQADVELYRVGKDATEDLHANGLVFDTADATHVLVVSSDGWELRGGGANAVTKLPPTSHTCALRHTELHAGKVTRVDACGNVEAWDEHH